MTTVTNQTRTGGRVSARRRWIAAATTAAAAAAVVTTVFALSGREDAVQAPAGGTAGQGAETRTVAQDPAFPLWDRGVKLHSITEWDLEPNTRIVATLPSPLAQAAYVRGYCVNVPGPVPVINVRHGATTSFLTCAGRDRLGWPPEQVVLEPLTAPGGTTFGVGDVTSAGRARIAVYLEPAPGQGQPRPAGFDTDPATAWTVVDSGAPLIGPKDPASPNEPLTLVGPMDRKLSVEVFGRGPGTLEVLVDGHPLSMWCGDDPGRLLACSSNSAGSRVRIWGHGAPAGFYNFLDNANPPAPDGQEVTVTVRPSGFSGDDWRVVLGGITGDDSTVPPATDAWTVK